MERRRKICPIMFLISGDSNIFCKEDMCAWWDCGCKCCSILLIAVDIYNIRDAIDIIVDKGLNTYIREG